MTTPEDHVEPEPLDPIGGSFQTWLDAVEAMSVSELIPELQRAMLRLDKAGEKVEQAQSDVWTVTLRLRDARAAEAQAVTA